MRGRRKRNLHIFYYKTKLNKMSAFHVGTRRRVVRGGRGGVEVARGGRQPRPYFKSGVNNEFGRLTLKVENPEGAVEEKKSYGDILKEENDLKQQIQKAVQDEKFSDAAELKKKLELVEIRKKNWADLYGGFVFREIRDLKKEIYKVRAGKGVSLSTSEESEIGRLTRVLEFYEKEIEYFESLRVDGIRKLRKSIDARYYNLHLPHHLPLVSDNGDYYRFNLIHTILEEQQNMMIDQQQEMRMMINQQQEVIDQQQEMRMMINQQQEMIDQQQEIIDKQQRDIDEMKEFLAPCDDL